MNLVKEKILLNTFLKKKGNLLKSNDKRLTNISTPYNALKVLSVARIDNPHLRNQYELEKAVICSSVNSTQQQLQLKTRGFNEEGLNVGINEVYLFHSPNQDSIEEIKKRGFDTKHSTVKYYHGDLQVGTLFNKI